MATSGYTNLRSVLERLRLCFIQILVCSHSVRVSPLDRMKKSSGIARGNGDAL